MKFMTAEQIRETWLNFFESKGHKVESSVSLIPQNDKTLLWINAGVAPLKKYFDGSEKPSNPRLTNVQKCIRTNDIENVGKTARHHTFFEMMGNFSIGDYFKEEAIAFAFELLTSPKWFGFPKEKLYMTYYPSDLEAKETWLKLGIKESHLIPRADNFWEIGEGPCGPDTEIYFDRGTKYDSRGVELIYDDTENERYIEIWNVVFSQYNSKPGLDRKDYPELPNKNIDTGAGLERFACVLQGTETNFETDLFFPIIKALEQLSNRKYDGQMSFKVIADHVRTLVFSISDGAMLSNEGRGYVLRRLLRRAVKYGRYLNFNQPFLHKLVQSVIDVMGIFYPKLYETQPIVEKIILKEEQKFLETINEGEKHLLDAIEKEGKVISGETAFKLYDTYGFPIELTIEYAEENKVTVDVKGFNVALLKQKEQSRNRRQHVGGMKSQDEAYLNFKETSHFKGYDTLQTESVVIGVFEEGIVLDQTPFYATMGGQLADFGTINGIEVLDVIKLPNGQALHKVEPVFSLGDEVLAIVDRESRHQTNQNHSATHLLHKALKTILGDHVNQQGSQVTNRYLRFDFNHYDAITENELLQIENLVKLKIKEDLSVVTKEMAIEDAKKMGAMALFGEKYGDFVRVVDMGWSIELCGGTHVNKTSEIKDFALMQFESIGSGIYRIEAVTGDIVKKVPAYLENAHQEIKNIDQKIYKFDQAFRVSTPSITGSFKDILNYRTYIQSLKETAKKLEKEYEEQVQRQLLKKVDDLIVDFDSKRQLIDLSIDPRHLKQVIDTMYDKIKADVLFVINVFEDKVTYLCKSNGTLHAGNLVKLAASLSNGSGGGKDTMAQGGTQDLSNLELVRTKIKDTL